MEEEILNATNATTMFESTRSLVDVVRSDLFADTVEKTFQGDTMIRRA